MSVQSSLLTAANYVLLAAAGITNSGSSVITGGNVGSFPTASYTLDGMIFIPPAAIDSADANQANLDGNAAYLVYQAMPQTMALTTADIGATGIQHSPGASNGTYYPGVYVSASSIAISTPVTLDAQGNTSAVFVFYSTASTITQAIAGTINLVNGAHAANVVWLVGSSWTTIGPGAVTVGNILAGTSITLGGGSLSGRALAGLVVNSGAITIATALTLTAPASAATPTTGGGQAQALIASQPGLSVPTAYPQVTGYGITPPQNLDILQIIGSGGQVLCAVDYLGAVHDIAASSASSSVLTAVAVDDFVLTSVAAATFAVSSVVGATGVYTGTFTGGDAGAFIGKSMVVLGMIASAGANNGTFVITGSTATTITVTPTTQVDETHAGTASVSGVSLTTYTGTLTGGATPANAFAGLNATVVGFAGTGNNTTFAVTASTATTLVGKFIVGQVNETHAGTVRIAGINKATYTGTITGGALSGLAGRSVTFTGFGTSGNNVTSATVISSTATTIVVSETTQAAETHAGSAAITASYTPTNGVRLGQYDTDLDATYTRAQLFHDAFANPSQLDIVHVVVPNSGNVVYILDQNGVASGS